ncbi:MAG: GGDEF domain-containing protein [Lachnospiraceae bacterium]|nr:GGDEF domain-containing protein [Lachnospiraceae bacterium]
MKKKFIKFMEQMDTLEERIFGFILIVGTLVVIVSAFVTMMENLSLFATLLSFIIAGLFLFILYLNFVMKKKKLSRLLIAYVLNCIFMPVTFYSCGGIDSGMPLYMIAGIFMIIVILDGKERLICGIISVVVEVCAIGISYNSMDGHKAKTDLKTPLLPKLTLEARITDMVFSFLLVAVFMGFTTYLILNAYQKERIEKKKIYDQMMEMSRRDALTGLFNRRELYNFYENMKESDSKSNAKINTFYIAMMDIDFFKSVNDTYGHVMGDKVLIKLAKLLQDNCNDEDNEIVVRYGGEEFVMVFGADSDKAAFERIDNLRETVEKIKCSEHHDLSITISCGLSNKNENDDFEEALDRADELLYMAKNGGRNMVCNG